MSYYAIIKSDSLKVIRLTDWQDYEWDDFNTVRDVETDEILLFDSKKGAINFMMENFNHEIIDKSYFKNYSTGGEYYFK